MFWWCHSFSSFAGPIFALFSKIFKLPSNDLQKDPHVSRYAHHEKFYSALCFYPKYVMRSYADTPSSVLFLLLLRKCLSKYSNLLVIHVEKTNKKKNMECFKAINAQQLKHLTNFFLMMLVKNLLWFQNGFLHSDNFSIIYKCRNILKYVIFWTWLKIIRRWKKNYKNRTVSIKYVRILNRRSSQYHNKHFLLLRLNCHNCFRHLAYCYCNLCICKTSVQGRPFAKQTRLWLHTLHEHRRNSNIYNINSRFWCWR